MSKIICILALLFIFNFANAENIKVFEFTEKELKTLKVRKVRGADNKTVYTIGKNADKSNLLPSTPENIQVIETDRGGDVTYHGPGQLVIYLLIDLSRRPYKIKKLVYASSSSVYGVSNKKDVKDIKEWDSPLPPIEVFKAKFI